MEDTCYQIRTVSGLLARVQIVDNLLSLRVTWHGDENVQPAIASKHGHSILIILTHVMRTTLDHKG